jgi:hypothetical protein
VSVQVRALRPGSRWKFPGLGLARRG